MTLSQFQTDRCKTQLLKWLKDYTNILDSMSVQTGHLVKTAKKLFEAQKLFIYHSMTLVV